MANILEYILSLKDQVSKSLAVIGVNSDEALNKFAALQKQSNAVKKSMHVFGNSIGSLREKLELLKNERDWIPQKEIASIRVYNSEIKKLTAQINKLETINGSKFKTWAKDAFSSLPDLAKNPLILAGAGMGMALKKGMEKDLQMSNMTTMFRGNEQAAKQMYDKIGGYAKATPYGKAGLIEAQNRMMAFGVSSDESFKKLTQIGDIALGDSQKMDTLSLAFGKLASTGRAQGDEINMMIEAGFNPLQIIYERTGESVDSLRERMKEGKLTADEVSRAFEWATDKQGLYYKGAERGSKTLAGVWSNIQEGFFDMLIQMYDVVQPIILPIAQGLSWMLDIFSTGLGKVTEFFKGMISQFQQGNPWLWGLVAVIGALTLGYILHTTWLQRAVIWQKIKNAWDWLSAGSTAAWATATGVLNAVLLANPVTWVILSIIALIAIIASLIYFFDGWGAAWGHLMDFLKFSWEAFKQSFVVVWEGIKMGFVLGINQMKKAWYELKSLWDEEGAAAGLAEIDKQNAAQLKAVQEASQKQIEYQAKAMEAGSKIVGKDGVHRNTNTIEGALSVLKKKAGLGGATDTGGSQDTGGLTPPPPIGSGGGTFGNKAASKTNEAIATGGTKNTTIHITIGKQIESLNILTSNLKEGTQKIREIIVDEMTRALAMSQAIAD